MTDSWHYGGGFAPDDEEVERVLKFISETSPDPHAGHEVVKNVANFKEFLYCRDCKIEVSCE